MSGAPATRRRIVIAEDDSAIAAMLEKVLSEDYDVSVAHDGKKALELASQAPRPASGRMVRERCNLRLVNNLRLRDA